jgi:hypothetical protein
VRRMEDVVVYVVEGFRLDRSPTELMVLMLGGCFASGFSVSAEELYRYFQLALSLSFASQTVLA